MSLSASALPSLAVPSFSRDNQQHVRASCIVVEAASPLARATRDEALQLGLPVHTIHDDVTDLWYHQFSLQWREAPTLFAGVTLATSLFCLATLAQDHGMRVWLKTTENYLPNGLERVVSGHNGLVQKVAAFGGDWSVEFARLAAAIPFLDPSSAEKTVLEPDAVARHEPGPMVSWIIGPKLVNQVARTS